PFYPTPSLLAQQQIQHPAAAHVLRLRAAMGENVVVVAAGFLQRVGEQRHVGEATLVVDGSGYFRNRAGIPRKPTLRDFPWPKWVAKDLSQQVTYGLQFCDCL